MVATLVTLSSLSAVPHNKSVSIEWSTDYEVDNAGFSIYRSDVQDGEFIKKASLIFSAGLFRTSLRNRSKPWMDRMKMEKTLSEVRKHIKFKPDTVEGDIILIGMPAGLFYGYVQDIQKMSRKTGTISVLNFYLYLL